MAKKVTLQKMNERQILAIAGTVDASIAYAVEHFISLAKESILDHGFFAVALSGGSTPKKIFQKLALQKMAIDWNRVYLFWSDERSVEPTHPDSNYHMTMHELKTLSIPEDHIFRMQAETHIEENALLYETQIHKLLGNRPFDLITLGMGEDGHTASLFPNTEALHITNRLVVANHIPEKNTWRMTFTFPLINQARHIAIYCLGSSKAQMVNNVFKTPLHYPIQQVGTPTTPALWILDDEAASLLSKK